MTHRSLNQIHSWRVPPNWAPRDWHEEMEAEAVAAAWQAERDFDPARGVPLEAFVHQRILAQALSAFGANGPTLDDPEITWRATTATTRPPTGLPLSRSPSPCSSGCNGYRNPNDDS